MSQLTSLPTELLLSIAESLSSQKDLSALVQTTKRTHTALQLYLYKTNIQNHNQSALLWAAKHGHTALTQKMLNAGARISTLNSSHNPTNPIEGNAIALATSGPHVETLACLLSEKRPGQACDPTQLRDALREGAIPAHSLEAAKLLLQYKAPLEPANTLQSYLSALGAAVAASWADIIPFLLEAGACPGMYEIPTPLECAIRTNQPEVVEMLLGAGMRLTDDAALCVIAEQNNQRLLRVFVEAGLEVGMCWQGALFAAVMKGQTEMVALLIEMGANPHLTHDVVLLTFQTPRYSTIGFAVRFGHLGVLKLLLETGVRAEQSDLDLAREQIFEEAVALLEGCDFEDLPKKENVREFVERKVRKRRVTEPRYEDLTMQGTLCPDMGLRLWMEDSVRRSRTRNLRVNDGVISSIP
ncbi:hypothetical protein PEX2_075230 [Penicillium expansum]|uniref:Uncharacterized protein n=1 Tax=Penicillium expansum TaxID=27334 RepID=A0A0A2JY16_PENEN|nr:hypothetical protein PEX2_075230 [Penicillium expansum]KGO59543.1 hypothetical protein PEX2_075230 [Penicillium expansum]